MSRGRPRQSISTSTYRLTQITSTHSNFDDRTFAEIGIQTETTLSINAADITWTPTCTSVIVERNIDADGMSTLERAIFAQECDELPSAAEPQYETDSDDASEGNVDLRGDAAEEETEDVAVGVRNSEGEEVHGPFSPSQELPSSECEEALPSSVFTLAGLEPCRFSRTHNLNHRERAHILNHG